MSLIHGLSMTILSLKHTDLEICIGYSEIPVSWNLIESHFLNYVIKFGWIFNRTEEEYKEGHLENSWNIPYMFDTPEGEVLSFIFVWILILNFYFFLINLISGRVKNPKFLEQVLSAYSKEDRLVVVRILKKTNPFSS